MIYETAADQDLYHFCYLFVHNSNYVQDTHQRVPIINSNAQSINRIGITIKPKQIG